MGSRELRVGYAVGVQIVAIDACGVHPETFLRHTDNIGNPCLGTTIKVRFS